MRRLVYISLAVVLFSFTWGVWWGFKPADSIVLSKEKHLRVLSPENVFSDEYILRVEQEESIELIVTEKKTGPELLNEVLNNGLAYDLVLYSSFLSDSLILGQHFQEIDFESIASGDKVSVDFLHLGHDPDNKYSFPLLWGVSAWLVSKDFMFKEKPLSDLLKNLGQKQRLSLLVSHHQIVFQDHLFEMNYK